MIVGIDPGFSGAIAILKDNKYLHVHDLPLTKIMGRNQIDAKKFSNILLPYKQMIELAIIEDVSAMPDQGVTSTFRFGYNAGVLYGVLAAYNIKTIKVKPSVWKSALNLSSDKRQSLALAKKVFPNYIDYFRLVKHDGRAEAALLAHFANHSL